jgi:hypothetical protein
VCTQLVSETACAGTRTGALHSTVRSSRPVRCLEGQVWAEGILLICVTSDARCQLAKEHT